ncbi:4-carboxy-4-hydroxy-2-oxoadipate aldolase/oxaloacetate decarboxylase [Alicyclobacillus shizuokensis]|uniref:4-carboxy-4-hydroxy-2-oxoadipate aldolase/oxaloacetate decarboxylase n=1 Tax=Alicyclobacillus shizuokensis TaxID=392014 RepID=UPI00083798A1|nr:4-carboxy-4-hydroxy-2-oxoadipate aldolase/oxaloacetate decarboxylase [Alicyclobacillus shizuokensis]MCL6625221.1 4-carboxy-4-hydroxy-2-oxoadipate aldolase/oxaloacetate decarboxylase [Alicyclobacillus shizuokensis]
MKPTVVLDIERPSPAVVDALAPFGSATVHESMNKTGLMHPYMRPIYPDAELCGTAVTVCCQPGDNLMIHAAIEACRPGDVLVVTTTSSSTDGMFGELLAVSARAHGVKGLIIEAGVRDTKVLTDMRFPVWAKAVSAKGTVKESPGWVNVPVVCAGVWIRPGDIVLGDADGVVVVPKEQAAVVAARAQERTRRENDTRARLARGELGIDIYGLRAKLRQLGVEYVER